MRLSLVCAPIDRPTAQSLLISLTSPSVINKVSFVRPPAGLRGLKIEKFSISEILPPDFLSIKKVNCSLGFAAAGSLVGQVN